MPEWGLPKRPRWPVGGDKDEDSNLVNIDLATGNRERSCKGHAYRGHCKHTDALATLVASGKL
jgi:hypothetical protein